MAEQFGRDPATVPPEPTGETCRCGAPLYKVFVKDRKQFQEPLYRIECEHCDHLCLVLPQSACEKCSALMANRR